MFGKKKKEKIKISKPKKKKTKKVERFDTIMDKSLYKTMFDTLMEISKMEYKTTAPDGQAVVDYEMTVRMIRERSKLSLNFVGTLKRNDGENEK